MVAATPSSNLDLRPRLDTVVFMNATSATRVAQWQAVHKRLLQEDPVYRKRHTSFLIANAGLSLPLLATYGFYFGIGFSSFPATLAVIVGAAGSMIVLSLRQWLFMNQRIGQKAERGS